MDISESSVTAHSGNVSSFETFTSTPGLVVADAIRSRKQPDENAKHIGAGIKWLKRAQDITPDDGFSYGYCLRGPNLKKITDVGWRQSYVETTGYIIETFYDCGKRFNDNDLVTRATKAAHWLMQIQNDDGSFSNAQYGQSKGIVFDTGQDLFGLTRGFLETGDEQLLDSARNAANWLVDSAEENGCWERNTHLGFVHTYNTRSAWAMLEYAKVADDQRVFQMASKNIDWALTQMEDGLFHNCAFRPALPPFTHTIAYAIRGILEAARLTNNQQYLDAAIQSATRVATFVDDQGFLPGRISVEGKPRSNSCCLTGNCQMAIIWYLLAQTANDRSFVDVANRSLEYVMSVQDIATSNPNVNGAIKGSHPIWGKYTPLAYPNWATKFFIDAMLLREQFSK